MATSGNPLEIESKEIPMEDELENNEPSKTDMRELRKNSETEEVFGDSDEEFVDDWDEGFAKAVTPTKENIDFFKRPAHVLGSQFFSNPSGQEEKSEGLDEKNSCKVITEILKGLEAKKDYTMSKAVLLLQKAMITSKFSEDSADTVIERLKKGIPVIIPTGWLSPNHSVGVYAQLINERLIIIHCNKGAGINESKEFNSNSGVLIFEGKPGVEIYKMLSDLFYREKHTISKNSVSAEFYLEFEGSLAKCGFKNIGFIPLQKQKIGICSIVNKIGLVAGIEAYQEKIKDKETWEASVAKKRYKEFTTACRKQEISLLVDRINQLEPLQNQIGYQILVDLIERKAEKACHGNLRSMVLIKFTAEKLINKIGKANSDGVRSDIKTAFMTHINLLEQAAGTNKERKAHEDLLNKITPKIKELDDFLTSLNQHTSLKQS